MPNKTVAVVGGGYCGLISIRWLKKEGLQPVCFEKTPEPGGTWCYREESTPGVASIMPTTIINHSKEMGAMSDFPPKPEASNCMRHEEMYRYILDYCEKHDLLKHVRFNTEVTSVKRTLDYESTGQWEVTVRDLLTGEETVAVYDGVTVCVGFINRPKMPSYPGQDVFRGKVIHSHSLKRVAEYAGKNVVVVGMGCSALDAAVETSSVAKQVYLSTRSGAWVMNRVGWRGIPIDRHLMKRWMLTAFYYFPTDLLSKYVEAVFMNPCFDSDLYAVKPEHHMLSRDPVFNDHIHSKLLSGSVVQKRDIERFTENGVVFKGDDKETLVDNVIMATGYTWKFPFLEEGIILKDGRRINLYKCIYPVHLPHATLAILGFVQPFGPGFPIGEMQCRLAAHLMAGRGTLPSYDVMMEDIVNRYEASVKRYPVDDRASLRVDFLQYLDELSSLMGAKPNLCKIFFTDFRLFWKMVFGPVLSYHYRLQGPHQWDGAREAIMNCDDRIRASLKSKVVESDNKKDN